MKVPENTYRAIVAGAAMKDHDIDNHHISLHQTLYQRRLSAKKFLESGDDDALSLWYYHNANLKLILAIL